MPAPATARRKSRRLVSLAAIALATALHGCSSPDTTAYANSPQFADGRFRSAVPIPERSLTEQIGLFWRQAFDKPKGTAPDGEYPVRSISRNEIDTAPDGSLWRLAHSTVLIKLGGRYWLTDPMFSERASPLQFMGPRRFHQSPITIDQLPPLEAVIVSHDHYDHLDHASVLALAPKTKVFLTPLGVGDRLVGWGVPAEKVRQFDWWQEWNEGGAGVRIVAVPSQHFSGRTLTDRNRTLWASWVLLHSERRIFFSGDTGYHAGFKTIGERFGPFDATLLECGAYNNLWPMVHMLPEQLIDAHRDLRGRLLVPVHNGSFDLGMHPWREPVERMTALAREHGVPIAVPGFGERVEVAK